ncbi:MAG TPA: beta-N-acetylglucosaminidase domain-containing protein [Caulobacteraceae bacterium]|nr:beta-N-acetylglucosaminidase domain-containing protein [Caulobacteraceae bacterium]
MPADLGIIEGYYGTPWTWAARREQVSFLKPHGYRFFIYAPKADPYLRKRWAEPHPADMAAELRGLAEHCAAEGVRFGVGLSPFEIYRDFGDEAKAALARKLEELDSFGVQDLGILFDDMRGDLPDLASTQVDIVHWIAGRTKADRVIMCPTYYSDDPMLDRGFGDRPAGYLEELGRGLDRGIEVFWTGEEVCSREYTTGHLARVTGQLGRKPFLWDNYPVNDGPRMSPYLYIRSFTGRPAAMGEHLSAHAVNPALQAVLSRVPCLTLAESYRDGDEYQYGEAFRRAAHAVLGEAGGKMLIRHLGLLNDTGLGNLEPETHQRMIERWSEIDHDGAREVLAFLNGEYRVTRMEE